MLRQEGHGLVHDGFLQVQRRVGHQETDVLCLAPSLDSPHGHPAIWSKLLTHFLHDAAQHGIERIYADVSDQPLLVHTFAGVGFQAYSRQTIWRLFTPSAESFAHLITAEMRAAGEADQWGLTQVYMRTIPVHVQQAEGWQAGSDARWPIGDNGTGARGMTFVMLEQGEICGALWMVAGIHGSWLQLWTDTLRPDGYNVRQLLFLGLTVVRDQQWPTPVYTAVSDYHGGLDVVLAELGFAPFSDRVKMVKQTIKWVREAAVSPVTVMDTATEVVSTSFAPPTKVH